MPRPARDRRETDYQGGLRSAVRGLWAGEISWLDSIDWMSREIERSYTRAWEDGLSSCGIRLDEQTPEEQARLALEINTEIQFVYSFANQILAASRANGGTLRPLYDRLDMWVNRYNAIRDMAMSYACQDQKLMWVMGYTKEHCPDCIRLSGRVYRASAWRKADLYPRKHSLQCGGWRCACEFVSTSQPATPGFPPRL